MLSSRKGEKRLLETDSVSNMLSSSKLRFSLISYLPPSSESSVGLSEIPN